MGAFKYKPLARGEIRVIELLTKENDPSHADGPVHCRIEHVSLYNSGGSTNDTHRKKGSDNRWPTPIIQDIEVQPGRRDGADSNVLWRRWPKDFLPHRSSAASGINRSDDQGARPEMHVRELEADLPWRYDWGDFVALSYVWGDPTVTREVFVNDCLVPVTVNLEAALRQLRNHSRIQQGFRIWVDAICINQEDLDERGVQVARMKEIYDKAWQVVIWLGPGDEKGDLAMTTIRYLSLRSQERDPLKGIYQQVEWDIINNRLVQWKHRHSYYRIRIAAIRAVHYFLMMPYWRRLWIIQEIASGSRKSPILLGQYCILLEDVYNAIQTIQGNGAEFGRLVIAETSSNKAQNRAIMRITENVHGMSEKLWERLAALIDLQQRALPECGDTKSTTPGSTSSGSGVYGSTFEALVLSREASTSDERDRIYGILGLAPIAHAVHITPNYRQSLTETFTLFSESLFSNDNLNGLRLVNNGVPPIGVRFFKSTRMSRPRRPKLVHHPYTVSSSCKHSLPSWVLCWSCRPNPAFPLPNCFEMMRSDAWAIGARPVFSDGCMTVTGIIFDTVSHLSAFHTTEMNYKYPQNGPPRQSAYGSISATREAFWRTIVANTGASGESPAPGEYSSIMAPQIWDLSLNQDSRGNMFGLNDFYFRNRSLMIFGSTLAEIIGRPFKSTISVAHAIRLLRKQEHRVPILRPTAIQREAASRAVRVMAWRRLVTTGHGYLGIVPAATQAGDVIAILVGCNMPLVLRPKALQDAIQCFSVIGECYVHGIMSGELDGMLERGECKIVDITLS